jgi:hypothetical protein
VRVDGRKKGENAYVVVAGFEVVVGATVVVVVLLEDVVVVVLLDEVVVVVLLDEVVVVLQKE